MVPTRQTQMQVQKANACALVEVANVAQVDDCCVSQSLSSAARHFANCVKIRYADCQVIVFEPSARMIVYLLTPHNSPSCRCVSPARSRYFFNSMLNPSRSVHTRSAPAGLKNLSCSNFPMCFFLVCFGYHLEPLGRPSGHPRGTAGEFTANSAHFQTLPPLFMSF